ncbi:MAG: hypothetical protein QM765_12630 [Myxococcales bacterium]
MARSHVSPFAVARRATVLSSVSAGALVFAVLVALPLAGLFLQGFDLTRVDLGLACALRRGLAAGSLYLSPWLGNGGALLARPDAQVFYPLRWLVLPFPEDWAVSLFYALHYGLAAAGAAWLARTFRARPLTAASVGVAFAFCGPAVDLLQHGSHYVIAATWLPWGWAAVRRSLHPRGGRRDLALLAAALVGLLLGGDPQQFLVLCVLVVLESALARPWSRRGARWRVARAVGLLPTAFAISLVAWLPSFAESALTFRAAVLSPKEALSWSFQPADVLGVLLPGALTRMLQAPGNLYLLLHGTGAETWNLTPYLGGLVVAASFAAFRLRDLRVAAAVAASGFVLALGDTLPVLPALMKVLPVVAWFRYPAKYLLIASLASVVAGGVLLGRAARRGAARRAFLFVAGPLAAALVAGFAFVVVRGEWLDALARGSASGPSPGDLPSLSEMLRSTAAQSLVPLAAALALIGTGHRLRRFVPVLAALDLALFALGTYQLGPPLARESSPLTQVTAKPGAPSIVWCSDGRLDGIEPREDLNPNAAQYLFRRRWEVPDQQACDGQVGAIAYSPLVASTSLQYIGAMTRDMLPAARAAGCTHVVSTAPYPGTVHIDLGPGAFVGEIPDPLPEVAIAQVPRLVPSAMAAFHSITVNTATLMLNTLDDPLGRLGPQGQLPSSQLAQVDRVVRPSLGEIRLALSGTGAAVAVVRDAFLVGWTARQADRELTLVRSSGSHLAVVVPDVAAGPVVLRYRPPRLALGAAGSALGAVLLGALLVTWRRRV